MLYVYIYKRYIYIYTRNAWVLRSTKVLGNIKLPPPLHLKFLWEKQKGTREYKNPTPTFIEDLQ